MRQDYKVFILCLDGLTTRNPEDPDSINPIPRVKLTLLQGLIFVLKVLGYRQASVSDAIERTYGRFFCPTFDVHDRQSLSDFNQVKTIFNTATVFIAPAFLSSFRMPDSGVHWDQFRELAKNGWEMGLAGYRYINLTSLRHSAQRAEIARSHGIITDRTGIAPRTAAFPSGTFDATTISCCKESNINVGIGFSGMFDIGRNSGHLAPKFSAADFSIKNLASIASFIYKRPARPQGRRYTHDEPALEKVSTGAK